MSRPHTPGLNIRRTQLDTSSLNLTSLTASSSNPGISRIGTPSSFRNVISLEEWESKAPLSIEQLQSISLVKEKFGERPFPEKFAEVESSAQAASRPGTPSAPRPRQLAQLRDPPNIRSRPPSLPGSLVPPSLLTVPDSLHPTSIVTPQQFHDHFTALTLLTEHEQDSLYRDHLAEIVGLREKCDGLIGLLRDGEAEVGDMLKALEYVEERSESLRGACEDLLEEQTHLLTHTSQLAHRLTFFTFLESAQRMLNNPGNNLVLSEEFLPMVKRLDECIGYLAEHRDFKDAELYLIRYQQCMTRSMTLIKIHFVNAIKALGQEVGKRLIDKSLSETASQALIYTKFSSLSISSRPLLAELEHRVANTPDELASLLSECHTAWVTTRQSLMGGRVAVEIGRMNPGLSDLVDLTRSGCSYLKQTCLDEFNLFKHFFLSGESQLYGFLEGLCDYLYDHLRPRILHEPSLEILCGVCTVLQALMVQDVADHADDDEVIFSPDSTPGISPFGNGGDDYFSSPSKRTSSMVSFSRKYSGSILAPPRESIRKKKPRKPLSRLHTEVLLKMVLQDAQTRLVFRAQALIRADVDYYVPKEGDLDYPGKIASSSLAHKPIQRQMSVSLNAEDDDEPAFLSLPPPDVQETWYPTLRVALWVLSCLYTYVDSAVFEDLAQEAVTTCRKSLTSASDLLAAKKDKSMDARLFLVRHLLILKEMTAGLELGRRDRRRDWQGISDFLRSLLDNAGTMLGYARGALVRPSDMAPDAKTDVDRELKRVCEDLIAQCTTLAIAPLRTFLDRCTAYLSSRPANSTDLSAQEFATPEEVMAVHEEFKKGVVKEVEGWKGRLMMYLQDEETVKVLVPPTQNSIVDVYRQFHDLIRAEYDFATAAAILTPSAVLTILTKPPNMANGTK